MTLHFRNKLAIIFLVVLLIIPVFVVAQDEDDAKIDYESQNLNFNPWENSDSLQNETDYYNIKNDDDAYMNLFQQSSDILDLGKTDPLTVTMRVINIVLTFLGIGFLGILIYSGVLWVLARGNTEQVEKSKKLIKRGLVGFVIILGSLGISIMLYSWVNFSSFDTSKIGKWNFQSGYEPTKIETNPDVGD